MNDVGFFVRDLHPGMGQAVAERTVLRKKEDGSFETWGDVADRVAAGNAALCPQEGKEPMAEYAREYRLLKDLIGSGSLLMSGRHLQHGDGLQKRRNMEVFTNCATSATGFTLFQLLLNGSGVGRCYDDDMMLVNWDDAPTVWCVLDEDHPDYTDSQHLSARNARHMFKESRDRMWFKVPDSREGWAKALELLEIAAFERVHKDKLLILDFSDVREKGAPIKGMQGRPSSGPVPLMNAFSKLSMIRGAGLPRWKQAMYVDHFMAECVLVGGARRAARMSTKWWKDRTVLDFIRVKRPVEFDGLTADEIVAYRTACEIQGLLPPLGFLWSSNNSVAVDAEFWRGVEEGDEWATKVFDAVTECAYADGTGEPGFVNVDRLNADDTGLDDLHRGDYVGSQKYQVEENTSIYLAKLAKRLKCKPYSMIVNPCVTGDTPILTSRGYTQIKDVVGQEVSVWNGEEWSTVTPFSTGVNEVLEVELSDGTTLRCTPYHKFLVWDGWSDRGQEQRIEAEDLRPGDKLSKYGMPLVEFGQEYEQDAYSQGFYSGDGNRGLNYSWVYEPKYSCIERLQGEFKDDGDRSRKVWKHGPMFDKSFVPVQGSSRYCLEWLAGLLDADGTVTSDKNGQGFQVSSTNREFLLQVRLMLTRLGVRAKVVHGQEEGWRLLPDGKGGVQVYQCKQIWRLLIDNQDAAQLVKYGLRLSRLHHLGKFPQRDARRFVRVVAVRDAGVEETFCFNEEKSHRGTFNGVVTGQCGEIALCVIGGYCVISSVAPYLCKPEVGSDHHDCVLREAWDDRFEQAVRAAVRALIRVNGMDSLYGREVRRTNRIGVGLVGIHEWIWARFGLTFREALDHEGAGAEVWSTLSRMSRAVVDEATAYSERLGVVVPHTATMIPPGGTISKLFGLTEGGHLPAMAEYLRWVQFRNDDPLVAEYAARGYPVRVLRQYRGHTIVGFPTQPELARIMPAGKMVTAGEAGMAEQYLWVELLERHWLDGEDGDGVGHGRGNQVSYTLKYDPREVTLGQFRTAVLNGQPTVRACAVMPQVSTVAFEYQPEEPISRDAYDRLVAGIEAAAEDVDAATMGCENGVCSIEFNQEKGIMDDHGYA